LTISIGLTDTDYHPRTYAGFVRRIRDRSRPVHTREEGTDVLKVILAAYRSAREKQEITL
jgi:predicted dehydrogenase